MAALLVALSVMSVMLSMALPVWQTAMRREREAELIFRGEQYVQAIALFQRRFAGTFPPSVDVLVQQKFLRRAYRDPITNGDFQVLYSGGTAAGARGAGPAQAGRGPTAAPVGRATQTPAPAGRGGVMGVASTSTEASLRLYNGRGRYNEWAFVVTQATTQAGQPNGGGAAPARGRLTLPPSGRGLQGGRRGGGPLPAPPMGAPAAPR